MRATKSKRTLNHNKAVSYTHLDVYKRQAIIPTINKAMEAGVAVFTFDIDAPDSDRLFCITAGDAIESGTAIGESLAKQVDGKGQVALLTGGLGSETLNQRLDAIKAVLDKYPDIEIVATEACDDNFEKCVSQAENLSLIHI